MVVATLVLRCRGRRQCQSDSEAASLSAAVAVTHGISIPTEAAGNRDSGSQPVTLAMSRPTVRGSGLAETRSLKPGYRKFPAKNLKGGQVQVEGKLNLI